MFDDKSRCEIHGAKELKKQGAECQGPGIILDDGGGWQGLS